MSETIIENGEIKKVNEPSQNESMKVKEKVVTNIKNSLSLPSVSEPYFVESDNWVDNACVTIEWYEHPFRARSSMLVLRNWKNWLEVFLRYNKKRKEYNAPGWGWNEGESPKNAAIRETQEECFFNVKKVEHCNCLLEYNDFVYDWVKEHVREEDKWRYWYYSEVYVSQYDSEYEGEVDEMDKDYIWSEWRWYPFDEVKGDILKEYKDAIEVYLKNEMK